jgi:hypothetical protein
VIQRTDVDQLHRDAGLHRAMIVIVPELCGEQGEQGAEALATRHEKVLGDPGQIGVVRSGRIEETILDARRRGPDARNIYETLEVVHS